MRKNAERDIAIRIEEQLYFNSNGYNDIIAFANAIMKYHVRNPVEQHLYYRINKQIKQRKFYIHHGISENVTVVQLMGTVGNANHAASIVGYCIFDSN